jgi:hypothetical protein
MPSSVFILSTLAAARTGSLNNGGVTGMLWSSRISMSAIFNGTFLSGLRYMISWRKVSPEEPSRPTKDYLEKAQPG